MSRYNKKDHYHRKAKEEGYLARSAYKLQEIQKKFRLFRSGSKVLDLGCAPGAWVQVALPLVGSNGKIVGVDLEKAKEVQKTNIIKTASRVIPRDEFGQQDFTQVKAELDAINWEALTTLDEVYNTWPPSIDQRNGTRQYILK